LFLDEIGDLPMSLQVKLLRVLQENEVVRVGSRKAIPLNVRLIAATNIDLAQAVTAGTFRLDLYYRLNVVRFELPPLRARRGDIMPLVEYFVKTYATRLQRKAPTLSSPAQQALLNYSWPGNIRELENIIHVALLTATNDVIAPNNLRFTAIPQLANAEAANSATPLENIATQLDRLFGSPPPELFDKLEEQIVRKAFAYCNNNQVQTAKILGVSRNILRTLLKRFGMLSKDAIDSDFVVNDSLDNVTGTVT
jgi:DNA-binding NtrC family response regulator